MVNIILIKCKLFNHILMLHEVEIQMVYLRLTGTVTDNCRVLLYIQ